MYIQQPKYCHRERLGRLQGMAAFNCRVGHCCAPLFRLPFLLPCPPSPMLIFFPLLPHPMLAGAWCGEGVSFRAPVTHLHLPRPLLKRTTTHTFLQPLRTAVGLSRNLPSPLISPDAWLTLQGMGWGGPETCGAAFARAASLRAWQSSSGHRDRSEGAACSRSALRKCKS